MHEAGGLADLTFGISMGGWSRKKLEMCLIC